MERRKRNGVKKSQGFTLVELVAVIGIAGLLLSVILLGAKSASSTAKISAQVQQIQMIYSACQAWLGNGRVNYSTVSLGGLQGPGLLPAGLTSPWGGAYTVGPGANVSNVVISVTNIPDQNTETEIASGLGAVLVTSSFSSGTGSFTF